VTPTHRLAARDYAHPPAEPIQFDGEDGALAWPVAQRDNLFAAIRAAHADGLDTSLHQLAHARWPLLRTTHDCPLWFESHSLGLQAARRCGDWVAERELLGTSAVGLRGAGRFGEAVQAHDDSTGLSFSTSPCALTVRLSSALGPAPRLPKSSSRPSSPKTRTSVSRALDSS
jgi:hypothetical protein